MTLLHTSATHRINMYDILVNMYLVNLNERFSNNLFDKQTWTSTNLEYNIK